MSIRTSALVAVLCSGVWVGTSLPSRADTATAQDAQPTAQELYTQGTELYETGRLEQAQAILRRVDELQLPSELRPDFYKTIAAIEQQLADIDAGTSAQAATTAAQMLAAGDAAMRANHPDQAVVHYLEVRAAQDATQTQTDTAEARLSQAQRMLSGDLSAARRLIALADQDFMSGNTDAAEGKLQSVQAMGVRLTPFEEDGLEDKLAQIADLRTAETAVAQAQREAPGNETTDELAQAQARLAQAQAQIESLRRELETNQVTTRPPQSDLLIQARLSRAQNNIAQADEALHNGQLNLAVQLYEEATLLDPENREIQGKLARAKAQLNQDLQPTDPLTTRATELSIIRQETIARYEQAMARANSALNNREFEVASSAVSEARNALNANRNAFGEGERSELAARAIRLQTEIDDSRERKLARDAIEAERIRTEEERIATQHAEKERVMEVQTRLRAARAFQLDGKYTEAIVELEAALFSDPTNVAVEALRDVIQDSMIGTEANRLGRLLDLQRANQQLINAEAIIPYDELLTYPGEWPELTQVRLAGLDDSSGESEANRTAQLALSRAVTVNFDATNLGSIIDYIRDTTGANIAANWPALELVGIDQDTLISITLARVPADQLLDLVLEQASAENFDDDKAGYSIIRGIIQISTLSDLKTSTDVRIYDIRDLLVQVPNFVAPEFNLGDALATGVGGGGGGGNSLFDTDDDDEDDDDTLDREELVDEIRELIQDTVGNPDEWRGEDSTLRELNGNLIVKSTNNNHREILSLLSSLRESRAVQISVEARFLLVDEHFLEEFGVDIDLAFEALNTDTLVNVDSNGDNILDTTDNLPDNGSNFRPFTVSSGSAAGNRVQTPPSLQFVAPDDVINQPIFGSVPSASNGIANRVINTLTPAAFRGTDGSFSRGLELGFGFVDDVQVDFLVTATLAQQNSLMLTAPRVTFFNGHRAYITVGQSFSFISDLVPIPDAIGFDPTLSNLETGMTLDVEGTVSSDRRYVTMILLPSLSSVTEIRTIEQPVAINVTDTSTVAGSAGFIEAPVVDVTTVRTAVSIPDRGTLLVGGQRLVGEAEIESGVPVLSKLPYINRLFTNSSVVKDERTLLILIKPTIIVQSEQEELLYPGLNDNPNAFNLGRNP